MTYRPTEDERRVIKWLREKLRSIKGKGGLEEIYRQALSDCAEAIEHGKHRSD